VAAPENDAWAIAALGAGARGILSKRAALRPSQSPRREVFQHAATGKGNKELAVALAVSEATVKVHLTRIFQKLGLRGRAELAAAYHGLLPHQDRNGSRARLSRPS
jgi:DNA-binding CsgD family transcriptional regulator